MTDTYLIVKGIAGLGDRLNTLAKAIQLARSTKRTLLIDWSDHSWNHDSPINGFFCYFKLNPIPHVKIIQSDNEIYKKIAELENEGASVIPHILYKNIVKPFCRYDHTVRSIGYKGTSVELSWEQIRNATEKVVVYYGHSKGDMKEILPFIEFKQDYKSVKYDIGVHVRNTDRKSDVSAILNQVEKVWSPGKSIYLATDDADTVTLFRSHFEKDVTAIMPPSRSEDFCWGIHHMNAEQLREYGLTKVDLNHNALLDITRLTDASIFIESPVSLFSRIVKVLRELNKSSVTLAPAPPAKLPHVSKPIQPAKLPHVSKPIQPAKLPQVSKPAQPKSGVRKNLVKKK